MNAAAPGWLLLGALAASCGRETDAAGDAGKPAPRLVASQAVHHFGEMIRGETRHHTFELRNEGEATLQIDEVRSSCGCAVQNVSDRRVAAGERSEVEVEFTANLDAGPQKRILTVISNDPTSPRFLLTLEVDVVDLYELAPAGVDFGEVPRGQEARQVVRIRTLDGTTVKALEVQQEGDSFEVELLYRVAGPADDPDSEAIEVAVGLSDQVKTGKLIKKVTVVTDHSRQPEAVILVRATVGARLQIEPKDHLDFGQFQRDAGTEQTIVVRALDRDAGLRIEEVVVDVSVNRRIRKPGEESFVEFVHAELETVEEGLEYRVIVRIDPGVPDKVLFGRVDIRTNDPDQPVQSVTVFGRVQEE